MGTHKKKKKKLNIFKFIRALVVLALIAAVIVLAVKTISGVTKGMSFSEALTGAVKGTKPEQPDPPQEIGPKQEDPQPEPPKTPEWPNTTTTADMYPLTAPDDDILVLVNKTHPMSKTYAASDFVTVEHCDPDVGNNDTKKMRKVAADAFEELHAAAEEAGYNILMRTGYRSYTYQTSLYNNYVSKNGEEKANTYSAKPGQSEHQTGLCCDVGRPGKGLTTFDGTDEAKWIAENAYKYGFILRFPEGKSDITGYIYESWHIRYVGKDAAKIIYEHNWTLEEYLEAAAAKQQ